jgi:hypothetical protein
MSGMGEDNTHDTHDMTRLVKSTWGWADDVRVVPGLAVGRCPLQTHAQKLQITADIPQWVTVIYIIVLISIPTCISWTKVSNRIKVLVPWYSNSIFNLCIG